MAKRSLHEISLLAWEKTQPADSGYAHKQSKHCKIHNPTAPPAARVPTWTVCHAAFAQSATSDITHLEDLQKSQGKKELGKTFGKAEGG